MFKNVTRNTPWRRETVESQISSQFLVDWIDPRG